VTFGPLKIILTILVPRLGVTSNKGEKPGTKINKVYLSGSPLSLPGPSQAPWGIGWCHSKSLVSSQKGGARGLLRPQRRRTFAKVQELKDIRTN